MLLFIALIGSMITSRISYLELSQKISNLSQENELLKEKIKERELENNLLKNQTSSLQSEISKLKSILTNTQSQLDKLQSETSRLQDRISKERIVQPSYSDVLAFMEEDDTDKQRYVSENYTFICTDFTDRFIGNFLKKGFFSCEAILYFPDNQSHSIVAINTTDEGLVFIDPQIDKVITSLRVGDNYCDYINQDCDWKILSIKHCFQH
jgi:DNA gyrase/topoisomerase IV subunit A